MKNRERGKLELFSQVLPYWCSGTGESSIVYKRQEIGSYYSIYTVVDSRQQDTENTQRDIFHIFTSKDIDHVIIFRQ